MESICWNYCKDPYSINKAIEVKDLDWPGITVDNIISITYDNNHGCYVVFWRYDDDN